MRFLFIKFIGLCILFTPSLAMPFSPLGFTQDECARCHGNQKPEPANDVALAPLLPKQFSMQWNMIELPAEHKPPFADLTQQTGLIRGTTHYDWDHKSMTEIYRERCIDIFPDGRDFPCQFLSVGPKTYFIKFSKEKTRAPVSCCQWGDGEFWAPRPDVLRHMNFQSQNQNNGETIHWWLLDIPLPGPFGYGLRESKPIPEAFWFPVISGWVFQKFYDFEPKQPPKGSFDLPALCRVELKKCS